MLALRNVALLGMAAVCVSCQPEAEQTKKSEKYLYATSGLCYSGSGITTFNATTASNQIIKINAKTGVRDSILADYFASPASAGDTPIAAVDWDKDNLLILVRNGNSGRLETMPKKGGTRNAFGTTPAMTTILATAPQAMIRSYDGGVLIIRTGFIEKISASGVRNSSVFVNNNLGATCGTSTLLTTMAVSNTGRVLTANAAATPNNRLISVPPAGANGSCDGAQAAPATTTYATAMLFDTKNSKVIVAYAGPNTNSQINVIYSYDYDESNGAISNAQLIYDANAVPATYSYTLFGISAMTLDPETSEIYIATAISTATTVVNYAIEKFTYDPSKIGVDNTKVLVRQGTIPFYNYGVDTKCISSLVVATTPEQK